jgi:hypothetical protein
MRSIKVILALAALPLLGGCLAKTAFDIVTAPVKVVGKAADMATTSQSEADEKRGRAMREREERLGKLDRQWRKLDDKCGDGDREACAQRDAVGREIDSLMPGNPPPPDD